jgi:hypothetical protein
MELTDLWPPFPIIITDVYDMFMPTDHDFDTAFAYHNRICEISLITLTISKVERLASAMRVQFPALIDLRLQYDDEWHDYHFYPCPTLPDGFLNGSVSRLQSLELRNIAFPGLPKLLLSVTHLVSLTLFEIPNSGYFSPETMVASLSGLAYLKSLIIEFPSPPSRRDPGNRRSPPTTRTSLPALTRLEFQVDSEYLEDFVARIDVPLLDSISITFFYQLRFDIPELARFIRRTTRFKELNETHVDFFDDDDMYHWGVQVGSLPPTRILDDKSKFKILCEESGGLPLSLANICTSFFPSIYMVQHLHFHGLPLSWHEEAEDLQWLDFFRPFTGVKNLYVSQMFARFIALALQDLVGERVTEVLPTLESIFLEDLHPLGPVEEAIGEFVAARQLSGHPVAVSHWKRGAL